MSAGLQTVLTSRFIKNVRKIRVLPDIKIVLCFVSYITSYSILNLGSSFCMILYNDTFSAVVYKVE